MLNHSLHYFCLGRTDLELDIHLHDFARIVIGYIDGKDVAELVLSLLHVRLHKFEYQAVILFAR